MRALRAIPAAACLTALVSCSLASGCRVERPDSEPTSASVSTSGDDPIESNDSVEYWRGLRRDHRDGSEAPIEVRVESILGSSGRLERLKVGADDDPYRGFAVELLNPKTNTMRRYYTNSVNPKFVEMMADTRGHRRVWQRSSTDGSRRSRMISERIASDRWRRTQSVSDDGGRTWTILWEDELRRIDDR